MNIPEYLLKNRAYTSHLAAFNPQMPGRSKLSLAEPADIIPPAVEVQADGSVICRFYAPAAQSVTIGLVRESARTPLTKGEGGVWEGVLTLSFPGINPIVWLVDGVEVLNPYAPIEYSYGHPVNFVDVPCVEQSYLALRDVPHGSLVRDYYKSATTGETESCMVYLPPCYFENTDRRYPVLYLQHGAIANETAWVNDGRINFMMDNLLADGEAEPFIIVMNNGTVQVRDANGVWQDNYHALQPLLIDDCIPFIDRKYRTLADRWNRAIAGLSMGSMQAGRIFMERMDLFASAGLFTGYKFNPTSTIHRGEKQEYVKVLDDAEKFNRETRLFFLAVGADEPSVVKVEGEHNDCIEKGIDHFYKAYPGEHEWHVWRAACHDFCRMAFKD